jgi:hypothetical protein
VSVAYLPDRREVADACRTLAEHYGCSVRWLKYRLKDGMPSELIAGRRKMRLSETDPWLEAHGWKRG